EEQRRSFRGNDAQHCLARDAVSRAHEEHERHQEAEHHLPRDGLDCQTNEEARPHPEGPSSWDEQQPRDPELEQVDRVREQDAEETRKLKRTVPHGLRLEPLELLGGEYMGEGPREPRLPQASSEECAVQVRAMQRLLKPTAEEDHDPEQAGEADELRTRWDSPQTGKAESQPEEELDVGETRVDREDRDE